MGGEVMAEKRIYGQWSGNKKGSEEDETRCIAKVWNRWNGMVSSQCSRKRGYGKNGLFCKQHAKKERYSQ